MLKEWYNHKVIESLNTYKKQVIADLKQLPKVDRYLVKQHNDFYDDNQLKNLYMKVFNESQNLSKLHRAFDLIQEDFRKNYTNKDREIEIEQNLF